jgi:hypothetical protein
MHKKLMPHEVQKAPKDMVDKASEQSMNENKELLKKLEEDELMFVKKMPSTIESIKKDEVLFPIRLMPSGSLAHMVTSTAVAFSIGVKATYNVVQSGKSEPIIIGA